MKNLKKKYTEAKTWDDAMNIISKMTASEVEEALVHFEYMDRNFGLTMKGEFFLQLLRGTKEGKY